MLVSINGFYGSGGNEIGTALAKRLGYTLFNNDLTEEAITNEQLDLEGAVAEAYGEEAVKEQDPGFRKAILSLHMDVLPIGKSEPADETDKDTHSKRYSSPLLSNFMSTIPLAHSERCKVVDEIQIDHLRKSQKDILLDKAKNGNAVFLGKGSSYLLKGEKDTFSIFVTASLDACAKRISGVYGISDLKKCQRLVDKTNERRAEFFETLSGLKWDDPSNYDLCINTNYLTADEALEILTQIIELKSLK